ncbi:MAG TPA: DUF4115 domain-containing protein, partial [Paracoccus sp. (in: a-proteobacteria)]|nr:DUF4115 domain-containing protein [Paracoccus sp. (in: a-proteobacteria)]
GRQLIEELREGMQAEIPALDPVQEVAPIAEQDVPVDLPQPQALDRVYRPQTLDVPVLTPRDTPIASIDPDLPAAAQLAAADADAEPAPADPMADAVAQAVAQAAEGPQLPAEQGAVRTVAPDAPQLEILAARPAWVRVTSADGTVILEKTMDAGERFALPKLEQPPVLRTGNSGAV